MVCDLLGSCGLIQDREHSAVGLEDQVLASVDAVLGAGDVEAHQHGRVFVLVKEDLDELKLVGGAIGVDLFANRDHVATEADFRLVRVGEVYSGGLNSRHGMGPIGTLCVLSVQPSEFGFTITIVWTDNEHCVCTSLKEPRLAF